MKIFICTKQLYLNNIINPIINKYQLHYNSSYNILFIKDSKIINKHNNYNNLNYTDKESIQYDYIIYKTKLNNKNLITFHTNINNIEKIKDNITHCNFEFILVVIKTTNGSYDITNILKNKKNYYYVINNNLFDNLFMNWLFINHIKYIITEYDIVILDNMANEHTLNKTQYIKLNQSNYEIINNI